MDPEAREALKRITGDIHTVLKALHSEDEDLRTELASTRTMIMSIPNADVESLKDMIRGLRSQVDEAVRNYAATRGDVAAAKALVVETKALVQKDFLEINKEKQKVEELLAKTEKIVPSGKTKDFEKFQPMVIGSGRSSTEIKMSSKPTAFLYVPIRENGELGTPRQLEYLAVAEPPKGQGFVSLSLGFLDGGRKFFDLHLAPEKPKEKKLESGIIQRVKDAISPP